MKLVIDTDPGIDDAMAIYYALRTPHLELLGITSIYGNASLWQTTRNALYLLEQADWDVPVAQGLENPREEVFFPSAYIHGREGLGDLISFHTNRSAVEESAPEFLCRVARENPKELTVCTIGPLTNIARAMELDPDFCRNLRRIVIMGGALNSGGNISSFAETNIYHDPHAASMVLKAGCPITMVGLDVTNKVYCTRDDIDGFASNGSRLGGLLQQMAHYYIRVSEEAGEVEGCYLQDPTALVACAYPELFETEPVALAVITEGERRGATVARGEQTAPFVDVCTKIDAAKVHDHFISTIHKLP